jgi:hypothetical protein
MAAQRKWPQAEPQEVSVARELVHRAYTTSGGPTPDLKRVYEAYLDNERRGREGSDR